MSSTVLQRIIDKINSLMNSDDRNSGPTIRERKCNTTIGSNIYNNIQSNWEEFSRFLSNIFEQTDLTPQGEIITYKGVNGKIIDTGKQYFEIVRFNIWECYFYEPELFLYVRLVWERDLYKKDEITGEHVEWLSIDIDLVNKSAWFEESSRKKL